MGWDTVTFWRREADGGWRRTVVTGARVEAAQSSEASAVGPVPGGETKVFLFAPVGIAPGDAMVVGASREDEPPAEALEVRRVDPWSVRHAHHHTEVTAR